jgi:tetratricopeptide (TPR) repeat protein
MSAWLKKILLLTVLLSAGGATLIVPAAAILQGLSVGVEAPDFSLPDLSGEIRDLSGLMGERLTVVIFWSTWSKNSQQALSRAQELHERYGDRGLSVIGVSADGQTISDATVVEIRATADRLRLGFPLLLDRGLASFHDYGVIALPTTVILGEGRVIRYELSGYPLVGSEEMADFVVTAMEGKIPETAQKAGYQPNKRALRLFNMGRKTLKSRRMVETAEAWFRKAIEADPEFVLPHLSLGRFYLRREDPPKAREQFELALSKDPENIVARCELGMLLAKDGSPAEGRALLEKVLESGEPYAPCYYYLGTLRGEEGRWEEALQLFEQARVINPLDFNVHVHAGAMCEERGMPREAAQSYKRALEVVLPAL